MSNNPTTWRGKLQEELYERGESFQSIIASTLTDAEMDAELHDRWADNYESNDIPFTVWTASRVYFPAAYDGYYWVASVPRYPCNEKTEKVGGG